MSELIERWVLARAFPDGRVDLLSRTGEGFSLAKRGDLSPWLFEQPEQDPVLPGRLAQLVQFLDGPVAEGELVSESARDCLLAAGYVNTKTGYTFLSITGVQLLEQLGFLKH